MNFNMGCGHNKLQGYVNVDVSAECAPDTICDLESLPWPWPDECAERVLFNHSLEHLGHSPRVFLGMMKELYRICVDGAQIEINVPHPRHDDFMNDPTHVRVITPELLSLFDRQRNDEWKRMGAANSPFGHYLGVDFVVAEVKYVLADMYLRQFAEKTLTMEDINNLKRDFNNVIREYQIRLIARKTAKAAGSSSAAA